MSEPRFEPSTCLTQAKNIIGTPAYVNAFSLVVKTAEILVFVTACLGRPPGANLGLGRLGSCLGRSI